MPSTGLGNRKALTPRTGKAPRRSLPAAAKLIEAESFSGDSSLVSSPDILTTKLHEKVKQKAQNKAIAKKENNEKSFNERLAEAAHSKRPVEKQKTSSTSTSTNTNTAASSTSHYGQQKTSASLALQAGRSKLSLEEFKASSESSEAEMDTIANTSISSKNYASSFKAKPISNPSVGPQSTYYDASSITNRSWNEPSLHNSTASGNSFHNSNNNSFDSNSELIQEQLNNLRRDYEALKARFQDLSRLRSTEAEAALEEHKRRCEARDAVANKAMQALQAENEKLKKMLADSRQESPTLPQAIAAPGKAGVDPSTTHRLADLERLLKIYGGFSGLRIDPIHRASNGNGDGFEAIAYEWDCEFSGRNGRFSFSLHYDPVLHRYQYLPSNTTSYSLPSFLATDILIAPDQMQIFFWRMLDFLTKLSPK